MQRPRRIVIFGVFCLIVGVVSGLRNAMETGVSLAGPDLLEQMSEMSQQMGQQLSESQQRDFDMQVKVLRKPVYRVAQGVESFGSMAMAVVLIVGGIGLLMDRAWAIRPCRWWAYYALPAAACTVVLTFRYIYPEMPDAPVGGTIFVSILMLLALWAFPVLLLRHLPTATVRAYLVQREQQRARAVAMPAQPASTLQQPAPPPPATTAATTPAQAAPTNTPATTPTPPADNTWRDDPWNDSNAH
ncbi:MAG: hypothetical protein AAF085_11290 [Planctomycetota bacterium]